MRLGVGEIVTEEIIWKQEKKNSGSLQWVLRGGLLGMTYLLFAKAVMGLVGNLCGFSGVDAGEKQWLLWLISTLGIALWNESVFCKEHRRKQLLGNGLLLLGLTFLLYMTYRGYGEVLKEGLQGLVNTYGARWEAHSSKFIPANIGNVFSMRIVTEFLLLLLIPLLQMAGAMTRRSKLALGLPIAIICGGLLVVSTPQWKDLVFVCLSGALFFYFDSCDRIEGKSLLGLGVGCLLFISIPELFQEKAGEWVIDRNGDWFYFQENLEKSLQSGDFLTGFSQKDLVDNRAPRFKDEEVIQLTMSGNPGKNIYLRGYHCSNYERGVWEKSDKAFQEACKEQGTEEAVVSKRLLSLLYESEEVPGNDNFLYELHYTGLRDKYTYFPYGAGWAEDPAEYNFYSDSIVGKAKSRKETKVLSRKELRYLDEEPILGFFSVEEDMLQGDIGLVSTFASGYSPRNLSEEDEKLFDWYTDFVFENYLQVPEYMKNVKSLAEKMKNSIGFQNALWILNDTESDMVSQNSARLEIAYLVANMLKMGGLYSWDLDTVPKGEDTVEYFVGTSSKGYCTHFASAGTLFLRELGIPARYVVGYVVKPGKISHTEGEFKASVLDSDAHAWTEIYLENYGWVPVEMTPGYQDVRNQSNQNVSLLPVDGVEPPANEEEEQPSEDADLPEEEETPSGEEEEASQEYEDEMPEENAASGSGNGSGKESMDKKMMLVVLIPVFLLSVTAVFLCYRYGAGSRNLGEKRLNGYLRREDKKRAVLWIHNTIYKCLVKKEHKYSGIRDRELLTALKKEFPEIDGEDWDMYFQVVQRAAYSKERITQEDIEECLRIYKSIQSKEKNS